MNTILLASGSPRRAAILRQLDIPFVTAPQNIDETFTGTDPLNEALRLAREKLNTLLINRKGPVPWALAADTIVLCEGTLIGKPANRKEAEEILHGLSGRRHSVITGLALSSPSHSVSTALAETHVFFGTLEPSEIECYLGTDEWRGAAGAYRIQGKGAVLIDRIEGSFSNVMGLPIRIFYGMLRQHKYSFELSKGKNKSSL